MQRGLHGAWRGGGRRRRDEAAATYTRAPRRRPPGKREGTRPGATGRASAPPRLAARPAAVRTARAAGC
ncbi:hypothetical protein ISF6_0145 [Piscinibacter sakaiensis]|uniref:Uncharacterized protein n=1 Tax=Piscinibacter sakaiensis TaxID=1547922 RepID=A0A0K8NTX2_PISS1|nr:hypothetical protein ISF6_0145 [Piscinibacter sakaiensis]